jgi:NhaP-type Na+/H+ or K+/H+ antiporter
MFGSILAATDPVATLSLLKDLGASKHLSMLVAGEALFNDGTALVLFELYTDVLKVGS